jgi:RNA-directed DNA polymerase
MSLFDASPHLRSTDEEIKQKFSNINNFRDICELLEVTPTHLHYLLFKMKPLYRRFTVPKKSGGQREILAPNKSLRIIQQKFNYILTLHYKPRFTSHGFVKDQNIVTNASKHLNKRNILNFDIEDFFSSVNMGRIRGIFINYFGISGDAATILANICCHENKLPQGAPTSPILSNMVCYSLDKAMQALAKQHGCTYTRYADDLTFSTTKTVFPQSLAYNDGTHIVISNKITNELKINGFYLNDKKTRLLNQKQRLEVTGITVNEKLNVTRKYIRNIRAMLNSVESLGVESAQAILEEKYPKKHFKINTPKIMDVLQGKLNYLKMVRGEKDPVFGKLARKYNDIAGKEVFDIALNYMEIRKLFTWVIEVGEILDNEFFPLDQGTGFFLKGVGFVTNAHVVKNVKELGASIRLHRSRYSPKYIEGELVKYDEDRDIAIIKVDGHDNVGGYDYNVQTNTEQEVKVIGYPNHNTDDSLGIDQGLIKQYRKHYMPKTYNSESGELGSFQERFIVSARIVYGNSGGPVVNNDNEVIGIATKGFKTLTDVGVDEDTETSVVVKITDVLNMTKAVALP